MSVVYDCAREPDRADGLAAAASAVRAGRLVVVPTDTVYGIGADAFSSTAVRSLLQAKNRGPDMPVGVLVGFLDDHRRARAVGAAAGARADRGVLAR